jgi:sulfur-carrier protein
MTVTVKLFATFRKGRFEESEREYADLTTVGEVIKDLRLLNHKVGAILLNTCHVGKTLLLREGDTLSFFPLVGGDCR